MHRYSSASKLWMILISIWINSSVLKLRSHSLKFRNQIDSDDMLVSYYPNPFYSNSPCDLSLLYLASVLNHKYAVCFMFLWLSDTNYLEGYLSFISFCVLFWNKLLLRVMTDFKQSHPTVNNLVQMILSYFQQILRSRMAGSKGKYTHGLARYSHTPLHRRWTILHFYSCMRCICLPTALLWRALLNFSHSGVLYLKFCLSLPFFPPRLRI